LSIGCSPPLPLLPTNGFDPAQSLSSARPDRARCPYPAVRALAGQTTLDHLSVYRRLCPRPRSVQSSHGYDPNIRYRRSKRHRGWVGVAVPVLSCSLLKRRSGPSSPLTLVAPICMSCWSCRLLVHLTLVDCARDCPVAAFVRSSSSAITSSTSTQRSLKSLMSSRRAQPSIYSVCRLQSISDQTYRPITSLIRTPSRLYGDFRGQLSHRIWRRFGRRMPPSWLDILLPSRTNRYSLWNPPNMDQGFFCHGCGWTRHCTVASGRFQPKWRPSEVCGSRQRRACPPFATN